MAAEERVGILIEKYGDMILRLCYTYHKNMPDAEDSAQDVFVKILEKLPEFGDEGHERAWMIRVTINTCKSRLRSFRLRRASSLDGVDIPVMDKYGDDRGVLSAVMALPERFRTVIHLYYYEEYSTPEIARLTGRPETTVRSDLHRARKRLKAVLGGGYDFE